MKVTADDIAQLLAAAPPRRVPAHVLQAAESTRGQWSLALFGLFFGLFSVPFMWIFFPWRAMDELRLLDGGTAPGVVTRVTDTRMRINKHRVMEYDFTFTDAAGGARTGACFANEGSWSQGSHVTVRYLSGSPGLALIEGGRLNAAGLFGGFVILFPLVGFGMVWWFAAQRIQAGRLLSHGQTAEVDILSVSPTNTQVNGRRVYAIVLSTPHLPAGGRLTIRRLNPREIELAERYAGNKQPVFILYDPRKPKHVIFPEALIDPA